MSADQPYEPECFSDQEEDKELALMEEQEERLAIAASNGLDRHDLQPLIFYLRNSIFHSIHPALLFTLIKYLEGPTNSDNEGTILTFARAPGAKRMSRSIAVRERIDRHRKLALVGFYEMEGWRPGRYEAGISQAAKRAGISTQRTKQLLTPAYRKSVQRCIECFVLTGKLPPFTQEISVVDFVSYADGVVIAIDTSSVPTIKIAYQRPFKA